MTSRYGVKLRKKRAEIMKKQQQKYSCPKCGKKKVKRLGFAEWECKSCGAMFAGGAYEPETSAGITARKVISSY